MKKSTDRFYSEFYRKWEIANRTHTVFVSKFNSCLNLEFKFFDQIPNNILIESTPGCSRGRPKKLFSDSGEKSKRRKIQHLTKFDSAELSFATKIVLRNSSQSFAAKIINEATMTTPTYASKIYNIYKKYKDFEGKTIKKYDRNETLALLIDAKLSKY